MFRSPPRPRNAALTSQISSQIHDQFPLASLPAQFDGTTAIMSSLNGASLDTHAPGNEETSITRDAFKITTRKLPILKAGPIEEMTKNLGIAPPEMIFGDNLARIEHLPSGWSLEFNAFDALDRVDKTKEKMLEVSYSKEWQKNR
jgi:type 2A phosphatase activator TIP41